ncbi:hypothetical protein [Methylobacterium sp. JK268]
MKPTTLKDALARGWVPLTDQEIGRLRAARPGGQVNELALGVDCNVAPEGTPCGGFGGPHSASIACFCHNGLCTCFRDPAVPIP